MTYAELCYLDIFYYHPSVTTITGVLMGRYVTVSTKVRKEVKEEAIKLGINISSFLRNALEEEVKRRRIELLKKKIDSVSNILDKIDIDRVVEQIRKDRDRR